MLSWLEISKSALIYNLKQFRKIIDPKVKLMGVIKSNAYGHGLIGVAKIIEGKIDYFGVASLDEALELRKNGLKKPILVLTYWEVPKKRFLPIIKAIKEDIEFSVYTERQAKILAKISQKIGRKVKIHLKIDTGTSRIGILPKDGPNFILKCLKLPQLELKGIFTHFAKSEAYNQNYTLLQTKRLKEVVKKISQKITSKPLIHAACTAATIINPATHLDMVRIGIGLYGLWPSEATRKRNFQSQNPIILKPALSWKTKIIQVKELPKGTPIGYDCTFYCKRKTKIAVLPIGYWDGYDRKLSNCGEVLIKGRRAFVRGRVCMNLIMVEVTEIPNIKVGDEVVLIGRQGKEEITVEEIAKKIGTINYEIVTRINQSLPRIYK